MQQRWLLIEKPSMRKFRPYALSVLLIICASVGRAQYNDYDSAYAPPAIDSVGSIEDIIEDANNDEVEDATVHFEQVTLADKSIITTRNVDDSAVSAMRRDDNFWYVNEAPKKEEPPKKSPSALNELAKKEWFRNLLWFIVVGGFIAVLIWFIISSDIQLFKKQSVAIIKPEEDDLINQSIFDINYDQEVQKAIAGQNFRLAIRLLYLQTLKRLSEENIINYKQERTNSDYLLQLFNTQYYKDFFRLTRHFEYAWYGQFPVAQTSFEVIKTEFSNFKQRFLS